jgi:hypothetical protein
MNKYQEIPTSIIAKLTLDNIPVLNNSINSQSDNYHATPKQVLSGGNDICVFINTSREYIKNGDFEQLMVYLHYSLPYLFDCYPKLLFVLYKIWFFTLKLKGNTNEAGAIFQEFLLPCFLRSEKCKDRANAFNVILRSLNVHPNQIKTSIYRYSEKFLKNLEIALIGEIRNLLPRNNINGGGYCKNRHQKILERVYLNEDDYCLSEIEDDIVKTFNASNGVKANNVFMVKKGSRETIKEPLSVHKSVEKPSFPVFKNFIEKIQNESVIYKPLIYLGAEDNMEVDSENIKCDVPVIDPKQDPSSNWNFYNRKFIPPVKKSQERLKDKMPFLKDFNPKFLKKENIDKKIIRKFRNFVKLEYKNNQEGLLNYDLQFIANFSNLNILPPMKYKEDYSELEFKSFNINYLLWLFSKSGIPELYHEFAAKLGSELLQDFTDSYELDNTKEEGIVDKMKYYINNIHVIYARKKVSETSSVNGSTAYLNSEDLLGSYLGDFENNNTFRLNNFETYPRCGPKVEEEIGFNFDMNCSMDSIQSIE